MRKMDEMELAINQKGIKWSWAFMVCSLAIWGLYTYVKNGENTLPLILLGLQFLVYFFVTSVEKIKFSDNGGRKQILFFSGVIGLVLVFGTILHLTIGR